MTNLGLTLPLERGNSGYFAQGRDIITQVKSNLTNLILTKKGERLLQPNFGCDVHKLIFQPITNDNLAEIRSSIESSIRSWMPFVKIVNVDIRRDDSRNSIYATLVFSVTSGVTITDSITLAF